MLAGPSESPVSIQEGFPSPGGTRNRQRNSVPEVKQRMTALRIHSARKLARA